MSTRTRTTFITALLVLAALATVPSVSSAPLITGVSPDTGSENGGTEVTITGSGFVDGALVEFDGVKATKISVTSSTSITATTPPCTQPCGTPLDVDVVVTNPNGDDTPFNDGFTYTAAAAPTVTSVSPTSGDSNGGTEVTVTGTGFAPGAQVLVFDPGSETCATGQNFHVTDVTSTEITALTTPHVAASLSLCIINPDTQSDTKTSAFVFSPADAPTLTSLSPSSGSNNGGTEVTVTGTNFAPGAKVDFDGTLAPHVEFVSSTELTVVTPQVIASTKNVKVINPDTQETGMVGFIFTDAGATDDPTITSIAPNSGPVQGGTLVTITGTNFHTGDNALPGVTIDGVSATDITVVSSTEITARTPACTTGPPCSPLDVDVEVTNPNSEDATLTDGFTYVDPIRILGVAPASGSSAGGTMVTLTGENFDTTAPTITIGGREAILCTAVDTPEVGCSAPTATSIEVITPPHAAGPVTIEYLGGDGFGATITNAYTYTAASAPTLSMVAPISGSTNGGTPVTITGTGFQVGDDRFLPSVTIGGNSAILCSADPSAPAGCTTDPTTATLQILTPARSSDADADNQKVKVTNPDGQSVESNSADDDDDFDYDGGGGANDPTIGSISPEFGPTNGGTEVTVTGGSNFHTGGNAKPVVKLGSTTISPDAVTVNSGTSLTFFTPAKSGGAASANQKITITNPNGDSVTSNTADDDDDFDYAATTAPAAPDLPLGTDSGPAVGGTHVTLTTGSSFNLEPTQDAEGNICDGAFDEWVDMTPVTPLPSVTFGGTAAAAVCVVSDTEINVITPGHAPGTVDVVLTNPDGQSITAPSAFTYDPLGDGPGIDTVAPATAAAAGGVTVTLTDASMDFGPPSVDSSGDGCGAGFMDAGEYLITPVPTVSVGGNSATDVCVSADGGTLTFTAPAGSVGKATIVVTNPDGQVASIGNSFEYIRAAPEINSVSPGTGSEAGGTTITASGSGFQESPKSALILHEPDGTTDFVAEVTTSSANDVSGVTPAVSPVDTVHVLGIDNKGQTATRANAFMTTNALEPSFTSVSPLTANVNGGTSVTIQGHGFVKGATVTVDGVAATGVSVVTAKSIRFDAPNLAATTGMALGPVDIVITNGDGESLTLTREFGYSPTAVAPPDENTAPTASLSADPLDLQPGGEVTFTIAVSDSDGDTLTWTLDFGDGSTAATGSDDGTETHTYTSAGSFEATLTVNDGLDTAEDTVTINVDGTAPGDITDLSNVASELKSNSITVEWTAPGDDGATGTVTSYMVKVSESNIGTEAAFDAADDATTTFDPETLVAAGETQRVLVTGLMGETEYTIAVRAVDEADNEGDFDTVTVTTATPDTTPPEGTLVVTSSTHTSGAASSNNDPSFSWSGLTDAESTITYHYVLNQQSTFTVTDAVSGTYAGMTTGTTVSFDDIPSGTWYFHVAGISEGGSKQADAFTLTITGGTGSGPDLSPAQIEAANKLVTVSVHREGDENHVSWELPSDPPATVEGVQIWRSNSPYTLLQTAPSGSDLFNDGEYIDSSSGALEDSVYLVTMFYDGGVGLFSASNAPDTDDYDGNAVEADDDGFPSWLLWLLIGLGVVILIVVILVVVVVSRKEEEAEDEFDDEAYGWSDEEGWDDEEGFEDEADEEAFAPEEGETHHLMCPNCETRFTATGTKPLVTNCPGCGKKGILR